MSENREELDPGRLESELSTLKPAFAGIDRDRLMFQAGAAAASQSNRRLFHAAQWRVAAVALGAIALGEAGWIATRPERVIERMVVRDAAAPQPRSEPVNPTELVRQPSRPVFESFAAASEPTTPSGYGAYARMRREVEVFGIDAIPDPGSLASASGGGTTAKPPASIPSAASLRAEINSILNLE